MNKTLFPQEAYKGETDEPQILVQCYKYSTRHIFMAQWECKRGHVN